MITKRGIVEGLKWWPLGGMIVVVGIARMSMWPMTFKQLDGASVLQERAYYYVWLNGSDKGKRHENQGYVPAEDVMPLLQDLQEMTYRKVENKPTYSLLDGNYYNFFIEWYVEEDQSHRYTLTLTRGGYIRLDWGERWYRMNLSKEEIESFMSYYKEILSEGLSR